MESYCTAIIPAEGISSLKRETGHKNYVGLVYNWLGALQTLSGCDWIPWIKITFISDESSNTF